MQADKRLLVSLFLSLFCLGATTVGAITTPANTTIAPYYGVDVARMAALATAFFLGFTIVAPLGGYLADLLGRKRLILYGGTILSLGLLLFGYSGCLIAGEVAFSDAIEKVASQFAGGFRQSVQISRRVDAQFGRVGDWRTVNQRQENAAFGKLFLGVLQEACVTDFGSAG